MIVHIVSKDYLNSSGCVLLWWVLPRWKWDQQAKEKEEKPKYEYKYKILMFNPGKKQQNVQIEYTSYRKELRAV